MNSAFGLDGKLFKGLTKAGDFIILGVITMLFCVPVITIGGALTAAFYSAVKLVKDEENYVIKDFIRSFKQNFLQGLIEEVILAAAGALLLMDVRAAYNWGFVQGSTLGKIFVYIIIGVALIWAAMILFTFAMQSRYDNKVVTTLKNALIVCTHHLPQTIIMMIGTYGLLYFSCIYFTAFIVTVPMILYVDAFVFVRIFKQLEDPEKNKLAADVLTEEEEVKEEE